MTPSRDWVYWLGALVAFVAALVVARVSSEDSEATILAILALSAATGLLTGVGILLWATVPVVVRLPLGLLLGAVAAVYTFFVALSSAFAH